MMMSRRRCAIAIVTAAVVLGLLVVVGLVGCGGGDSKPAASASATSAAGESSEDAVGPSAGPLLGDMDSDDMPTANDAQLIMDIVVDPDGYDLTEKWIADCEDPQFPSDVNTGDALKVLRAAAGEIDWPFPSGGPPPPPPI